jgi:hypothetical protein
MAARRVRREAGNCATDKMTKVSRSATSNSVSMDRIDWLDHAFS